MALNVKERDSIELLTVSSRLVSLLAAVKTVTTMVLVSWQAVQRSKRRGVVVQLEGTERRAEGEETLAELSTMELHNPICRSPCSLP